MNCSDFRFNLSRAKTNNTCNVSVSSVDVLFSKLFKFNYMG